MLLYGEFDPSGLTPRLRGDGYEHLVEQALQLAQWSGLTPRLRGDGYDLNLRVIGDKFQVVRTYAPFERGWLRTYIMHNSSC